MHRLRNLLAKLPKSEQDRIRFNYWSALTDATSVKDGKLRLQVLISELEHRGYESAARCLADDLDALVVHLRDPATSRTVAKTNPSNDRRRGLPRTKATGASLRRPLPSLVRAVPTPLSATRATARRSPKSTANTSTGSSTSKPTRHPRRGGHRR